jgi:hypothetical protein
MIVVHRFSFVTREDATRGRQLHGLHCVYALFHIIVLRYLHMFTMDHERTHMSYEQS